jgi:hypothetical protein
MYVRIRVEEYVRVGADPSVLAGGGYVGEEVISLRTYLQNSSKFAFPSPLLSILRIICFASSMVIGSPADYGLASAPVCCRVIIHTLRVE